MVEVSCAFCKEKVDKRETVRFEGKNYHEKCLKDYKDRLKVFEYVGRLFHFKDLRKPGPVIIRQLKRYVTSCGFTYEGVLNSLIYWYEVKHGNAKKANEGIGIVEYIYDEAQEYFKKQKMMQEVVAAQITQQMKQESVSLSVNKSSETKEKQIYKLEEL